MTRTFPGCRSCQRHLSDFNIAQTGLIFDATNGTKHECKITINIQIIELINWTNISDNNSNQMGVALTHSEQNGMNTDLMDIVLINALSLHGFLFKRHHIRSTHSGLVTHLTHWGLVTPIWRWRSWSALVKIMACCLAAPSHYLNQCWLIISKVLWHFHKKRTLS